MSSLNIVVLNNLANRHFTAIHDVVPDTNIITCSIEEAPNFIEGADILIAWGWQPQDQLENLVLKSKNLKWIHSLSAGVENFLSSTIINSDILLSNSRGIHGIPMAEHVLAIMLSFTRQLEFFFNSQKAKLWQRTKVDELYGKTIGIVGLGSIGREIAKRAKGLGMQVYANKRTLTKELFVDQLFDQEQLSEMLAEADFVVVTLPLTDDTRNLFNLELFNTMKKSSYFINISRGAIVNEDDLITALNNKIIQGAALDVFQTEPLPDNSPLWEQENLIITPHISSLSPQYLDRAIKLFCENLKKYLSSSELLTLIDKEKGY